MRRTHTGASGALYWPRALGSQALVRRHRLAREALNQLQLGEHPQREIVAAALALAPDDLAPDTHWAEALSRFIAEGPLLRELPHLLLTPLNNAQMAAARSRSTVLTSSFSIRLGANGEPEASLHRDPAQADLEFAREILEANCPEVYNVSGVESDGTMVPLRTGRELMAFGDRSQSPVQTQLIVEVRAALEGTAALELGLGEAYAWAPAG